MDLQLKEKVAIVTGASKGIGRSIAQVLASEGMRVTVVARSRDELALLAAPLGDLCLVPGREGVQRQQGNLGGGGHGSTPEAQTLQYS